MKSTLPSCFKKRKALTLLETLLALAIGAIVLSLSFQVFGQGLAASQHLGQEAYLKDQADYALQRIEADLRRATAIELASDGKAFLRLTYDRVETKNNVPQWETATSVAVVYALEGDPQGRKSQVRRQEEGRWSGSWQPVAQLYRPHQEGDRAEVEVYYYDAGYQVTEDLAKARTVRVVFTLHPVSGKAFQRSGSFALERLALDERGLG